MDNLFRFSATHSLGRLHSFPFLPLHPVSWPHEFSPRCIVVVWCVLCVPGACALSHPQPISRAIFESWYNKLARRHHWPLRSSALVLSAPTGRCVTGEAVNPPQSLNGSKTTHSFQRECFLTWFHWCFCCGSMFRSCVFYKCKLETRFLFLKPCFQNHPWKDEQDFFPVGPCHSFCTWIFQISSLLISDLVCLLPTTCFRSQHGSHAVSVREQLGNSHRFDACQTQAIGVVTNYSPVKAKGDKSGCVCVGEWLSSDGSTLWCVGNEFSFSGSQMGDTCVSSLRRGWS